MKNVPCVAPLGAAHLYIIWLGHFVQQLQGLLLEHVIWVFQAVDDGQLMLSCILGVDAHYACQTIDAHILQVVTAALQKCGDHLSSCTSGTDRPYTPRLMADKLLLPLTLETTTGTLTQHGAPMHGNIYASIM